MNTRIQSLTSCFIIIIFLFSCGGKTSETDESSTPLESESNQLLEKEAWRIHDEVMPRMGALRKWKNRLNEQLSAPDLSTDQRSQIEQTVAELDQAYQGMMDWMHNFKPEKNSETEESAREYLENQIEAINKVKHDILRSLEKAEAVAGETK